MRLPRLRGLTAIGNYKLFNVLPLKTIYTTSHSVGQMMNGNAPN
jgi:hypothetical protein